MIEVRTWFLKRFLLSSSSRSPCVRYTVRYHTPYRYPRVSLCRYERLKYQGASLSSPPCCCCAVGSMWLCCARSIIISCSKKVVGGYQPNVEGHILKSPPRNSLIMLHHVGNLNYDPVEAFPASVFELNVGDVGAELLGTGKRGREFENDDLDDDMHDDDNMMDSTDGEREAKRARFVHWADDEVGGRSVFC